MEFLAPVSNGYLYQRRVDEMGENAEGQDGDDRMPSISILTYIKLHVLLHFSNQKLCVNIKIYVKNIYILRLKLRMHMFISFTQHVDNICHLFLMDWFSSLNSCLQTLKEQCRLQNCDIDGTPTTH